MALLEVTGVEVRYGAVPALHDFTVTVEQGEIVTLLGANGAGPRDRCAGHDGKRLAVIQRGRGVRRLRARFDLSHNLQPDRKLRQICGAHRVTIACGSRKRRNIAVRTDGLGENSSHRVKQVNRLVTVGRQV